MKVLNFVWEYRFVIMAIVLFALYAVMDWKGFKADAYNYMLRAKAMAKTGILKTGKAQEDWVINMILEKAPKSWVRFLTVEQKRKIVKRLYNTGLDLIDDGKLNSSIN